MTKSRRVIPLALLVVPLLVAVRPAAATDIPFERAKKAQESVNFTGRLAVRCVDQRGAERSMTVGVTSSNGALRVGPDDADRLVATHNSQWLLDNGAWALMAVPDFSVRAPDAARKYTFKDGDPATIAGRTAEQVEVRMSARVLERLYFDGPTGLLLCRQQLDSHFVF